jgi:hypothetical protein
MLCIPDPPGLLRDTEITTGGDSSVVVYRQRSENPFAP